MGEQAGMPLKVLTAVDEVNDRQKLVMVDKIVAKYGEDLTGKTFALWGLAFKPQTDDMREAPSIFIAKGLLDRGAKVRATDPEAMKTARAVIDERAELMDDPYETLDGADALVVVTEWNEYRRPDFKRIKALLETPCVFDGRNVFNPERMREMGFDYACIGRA